MVPSKDSSGFKTGKATSRLRTLLESGMNIRTTLRRLRMCGCLRSGPHLTSEVPESLGPNLLEVASYSHNTATTKVLGTHFAPALVWCCTLCDGMDDESNDTHFLMCARCNARHPGLNPKIDPQRRAAEKTTRCIKQWELQSHLGWCRQSVPNRATTKIHHLPGGSAVFSGSVQRRRKLPLESLVPKRAVNFHNHEQRRTRA